MVIVLLYGLIKILQVAPIAHIFRIEATPLMVKIYEAAPPLSLPLPLILKHIVSFQLTSTTNIFLQFCQLLVVIPVLDIFFLRDQMQVLEVLHDIIFCLKNSLREHRAKIGKNHSCSTTGQHLEGHTGTNKEPCGTPDKI